MPGVMIVEAFGQAAAALAAYSLDPKIVKDKLVYLMSVQSARFRKPVIPPVIYILIAKLIKLKEKFGDTKEPHIVIMKKWLMLSGWPQ
jgi:3-hydroxyacyl-[acyl-carrier-protein] dehydratase